MTTIPPHERRQQKTREAILTTALELIVEKGPDGLSLREIARRIDYSQAGLYEYFENKDEIIQAACSEADARLRAYLKAVPAGEYSPQDYLLELGEAYLNFARQNPEHYQFLFIYRDLRPDLEAPRFERPEDFYIPTDDTFMIIYNAVQSAIDTGVIHTTPGFQTMEISFSLWALGHGLASLEARLRELAPFDFDHIARMTFEHYLKSLSDD
jgi:AcrR family transcriptional regulator